MKIVVDAMGGDYAPKNNIEGVKLALNEYDDVKKIILVGDANTLRKNVDELNLDKKRIEIVHSSQIVEMHDGSIQSVRQKRDSSISRAVDLLKNGEGDCLVSAGHTGATVAAVTVKLRLIKGVFRPAIASSMPSEHGQCSIIDAGANIDSKPEHLFQNAIMGSIYANKVFNVSKPTIGLISVGEEESKVNKLTKEVFQLLKNSKLNFIGNVEGHDLFEKNIDVLVCDGFIGNVILKSCEATAKIVTKWLKREIKSSPLSIVGAFLAQKAFKNLKKKGSYENYGGSPLLGTNGTVIIAHGSSSPLAIKNAIKVAKNATKNNLIPEIENEIKNYDFNISKRK